MIIILDWDGTLVDSTAHIVKIMRRAAASTGLPVPAPDAVRHIIGLGLPEAVRCLYPDIDSHRVSELCEAYSHCYMNACESPPPLFPGVLEGLEQMRAEGLLLAIATGKSRRGLERELNARSMGEYFHISRCADETTSKPHPRMLREILKETGKSQREAVMVGDTLHDMKMARNAGVRAVAVTYGAHSREDLQAFEPDLLADDFCTILDWLNRLKV